MVDRRLCVWVWNRSPDLGLQAAVVPDEPVAGRGRSRRDIAVVGEGKPSSVSFYKPDLAQWGVSKAPVIIDSLGRHDDRQWAIVRVAFHSPITYL